jgi:hypothetical protein
VPRRERVGEDGDADEQQANRVGPGHPGSSNPPAEAAPGVGAIRREPSAVGDQNQSVEEIEDRREPRHQRHEDREQDRGQRAGQKQKARETLDESDPHMVEDINAIGRVRILPRKPEHRADFLAFAEPGKRGGVHVRN